MDSSARTLAKTVTWQVSGFLVMSVLSWAITGSWTTGGAIALGGLVLGSLTYVIHERIWARVPWGRGSHPLR